MMASSVMIDRFACGTTCRVTSEGFRFRRDRREVTPSDQQIVTAYRVIRELVESLAGESLRKPREDHAK